VLTNTDLPRDFACSGVNKRVNKALTKGLTNDPGKRVWKLKKFEEGSNRDSRTTTRRRTTAPLPLLDP
jgi:hypothetical protein